jgi:heat shock protein beta
VFITDEFKDLLPRYLNFIRGVVDSDDLPLNVSREVLQENRLIKVIRKRLTRKVLSMISDIVARDEANAKKKTSDDAKGKEAAEKKRKEEADEEIVAEGEAPPLEPKDYEDDEEDKDKPWTPEYPKFWAEYGKALRLGIIEDPANKAKLVKLLRYQSSRSNGSLTTFEEYVDRMQEDQKGIFFVTGESVDHIEESPLMEWAQAEGVEVLYLAEPIDEFVASHITEYANHKMIDMSKATRLRDETKREELLDDARKERWEPFMKWIKTQFSKTVEKVVLSKRLLHTPCVLTAPHYGVSATMQRILKAQALTDQVQHEKKDVKRVFELNPRHAIVDELRRKWEADPNDTLMKDHLKMLYQVASLQSGYELEDAQEFAARLHRIVKHDLNIDENEELVEEEDYLAGEEVAQEEDVAEAKEE